MRLMYVDGKTKNLEVIEVTRACFSEGLFNDVKEERKDGVILESIDCVIKIRALKEEGEDILKELFLTGISDVTEFHVVCAAKTNAYNVKW